MDKRDFLHEIIEPIENLDVNFKLFEDSGSYISNHWHNSLEIIYLISGDLQVNMEGSTYNFKANDCIIINSGIIHSTRCVYENTSILLQIPLSFLNKYIPDCKDSYFDFKVNINNYNYETNLAKIKTILKDMKEIKIASPQAGNLRFTGLLFEFLFQIYTNFRIPIGDKNTINRPLELSRFEPVLEYTRLNYKNSISINEIAQIAHLQPEYFCRKFKQYMGQTYLEYLNDVRISYIYRDLINTNNTLCSILESHGFTNNKLFYKLFRKKFNCTPKEIRKKLI
ncbi:AraC family transcriptional regulator [Romboutsia sp. 1001285H_161024_C4]|uniref:AraC family transcriptional regulator n=1 Tax=Romboutsia sp. 1001285H_161024_C4 TaxID=2787109 RepID=UPI001899F7C7|nr:AraC family transcriptional regulator [Romboutsia sp. 1001285H_161024_C4]